MLITFNMLFIVFIINLAYSTIYMFFIRKWNFKFVLDPCQLIDIDFFFALFFIIFHPFINFIYVSLVSFFEGTIWLQTLIVFFISLKYTYTHCQIFPVLWNFDNDLWSAFLLFICFKIRKMTARLILIQILKFIKEWMFDNSFRLFLFWLGANLLIIKFKIHLQVSCWSIYIFFHQFRRICDFFEFIRWNHEKPFHFCLFQWYNFIWCIYAVFELFHYIDLLHFEIHILMKIIWLNIHFH